MAPATSHHTLPPFPDDVPTAPLVSVSLAKLEAHDSVESLAFFQACRDLGFFYLDAGGSALGDSLVDEAEQLHTLAERFFNLPRTEKAACAREKIDPFFGYRVTPEQDVDGNGEPERVETYNMRKDDFVGNSPPLPCPELITNHTALLTSYVKHNRNVVELLLAHLETHLKLPPGALASLHRVAARSGDHVRFNRAAPQPFDAELARLSEHTDFGSITVLFNWLGGLQIRLPEKRSGSAEEGGEWVYVRPLPGRAVVNLGDAMVKLSAGVLRSNVHRVVPAPAAQNDRQRLSLVYFARPEDDVVLRRLPGGLIDAQPAEAKPEEEMTAAEWILRRSVGDLKGVYTRRGGMELRQAVAA